ncbi:MAG: LuxR family transcriptional regulator [Magnetovibrionaceae bacterium]
MPDTGPFARAHPTEPLPDLASESASWLQQLKTLSRDHLEDDLRERLPGWIRAFGYEHFAYHVVRQPKDKPALSDFHSYPRAWIKHYDEQGYARLDATLMTAGKEVLAYRWKDTLYRYPITPQQQQVFDEAREHGLHGGAVAPLHGPNGSLSVFALTADIGHAHLKDIDWIPFRPMLQVLGIGIHDALLKPPRPAEPCEREGVPEAKLTPREIDVLSWSARGLSQTEIADRLKISKSTVDFHARSAMGRLCVHNRHHAVVRALLTGQITL